MKKNTNKKKSVIILIVLLLISSLNFLTTVSASAYQDNNDGVWFDDFEDASEIDASKSSNYNFSDGLITLKSGTNIHYYDYNDINQEAWESNLTVISGEKTLLRPRSPPLEASFGYDGYSAIKKKDGKVIETKAGYINKDIFDITYTFSPVHHFRFKIGQNKNNINDFKFSWWYGNKISDANVDYIQLYVWNYFYKSLGIWISVGDAVSYDNVGSSTDPDIYLTSNNTKYVSDDGYIDFLVVAIPKENGETCILATNYVNLTVITKHGYFDKGYVVSNEIKPISSSLVGWESIIWNSYRVINTACVKIQVLKSDGSIVNDSDLPGNSKGFTTSPIYISRLPTSIAKIRLKASLNSSDLSVTPWLRSWGVTWQTRSKQFMDNFSTDLRIDKNVGVNISGGDIKISDFYSDWAIFGKNPANTRSYEGYGPQKSELYWNTKKETVGGGFRSPVMSRGVIYIPSSVDDMIYAFNATVPYSEKGNELMPFDGSNPSYIVDASVAVANNFVIVATSETNASNKIYALNKSNLKDEEWNYSYPGDICFSSAPTVADGKVFITSWSGKYWDNSLLSFLKKIIGGNSKIIALRLDNGNKVWINDLPAGSFSTPAVADGKVFVGCDNMYGSNLFAFDEETGIEIWNKKIGLIGGASPVVSNGKVFVVVKKQGPVSIKGDVKIVALNENDGTIVWNKTLAKNIPAFESLPKGLRFYNLMPTSTPAVKENTNRLYVTSPDGKVHAFSTDGTEIWNTSLPSAVYGIIPTYSCTSPVVADDVVYVASTNGVVHALKALDGKELWEFNLKTNDPELLAQPYILASPIVADGIIYVSATEELSGFSGGIYSIGNYTSGQKAWVVSYPLHVPTGNWWQKFQAYNSSKSGITFSILDENYNILLSGIKNNDPISDSSKVNTSIIRLSAEFSRKNKSQNPTLYSWGVTWSSETNAPVFNSFSPGGWINTNTPTCTILVKDTNSGLDIASAKYQIKYKSDENKTITTDSITAYCSGKDGTKDEQLFTANILELDLSKHIVDLINIKISIKDLAGNEATFQQNFQMDTVKPTSQINGDFSDIYNEPVAVKANASDGKSGVKTVALYYRYSSDNDDWRDWKTFSNSNIKRPYEWLYNGKDNESGYYELCTIATDNASNKEDFPENSDDERIVSFIYDTTRPFISTEFVDEYSNKLPEFSIKFEDDFMLEKVEYRANFNNNWTLVKDNIDGKSYAGEWSLAKEDWDNMTEKEEYRIYFKLTDFCGNQYTTPTIETLKIIKDLTTSKSYLDLSDFQDFHLDDKFTIATSLHGEKNITKMALYYRYSADKEEWSKWKQYGEDDSTKPFEWKFTANEGSGYYEFYTKAWDSSGIAGESEPESINVALFPMTAVMVMIFLAIILILISAFILIRMKKKKT